MKDTLGRENRKLQDHVCPVCGRTFHPRRAAARYCSHPCMWSQNGGHNRKDEGWWINAKGYVEGRIWEGKTQRRVKLHRYLMEQHLGRPLQPGEDVHHINGDKADNRLENLEIVTHAQHTTKSNNGRTHAKGYTLTLSDEERQHRADRMREVRRAAIAKATGGKA